MSSTVKIKPYLMRDGRRWQAAVSLVGPLDFLAIDSERRPPLIGGSRRWKRQAKRDANQLAARLLGWFYRLAIREQEHDRLEAPWKVEVDRKALL